MAQIRPRPAALMRTIRAIARTSENVYFGAHARQRLIERGITDAEALRVLIMGEIDGDIVPGNNDGEWKCKVTARIRGNRDIGVVTLTLDMTRLFVITVEWEDP